MSHPTQCPIHDDGPSNVAALADVQARLAEFIKANAVEDKSTGVDPAITKHRSDLLALKRDLVKKVNLYHLHLQQYETQRKKVASVIQSETRRRCRVSRFCERSRRKGKKICNMVRVLLERRSHLGPIVKTNTSSFADQESCDAYFHRDVLRFHLSPGDEHHSGLLAQLIFVWFIGDHGQHFADSNSLYDASTMRSRFGKIVHDLFLYSYHAYNPCDGAGVVPKRLSSEASRQHQGPIGGEKKKRKKRGKKVVKVGAFPCKLLDCPATHYKTAGGSNKHMANKHSELQLVPFPLKSFCGALSFTRKSRVVMLSHCRVGSARTARLKRQCTGSGVTGLILYE